MFLRPFSRTAYQDWSSVKLLAAYRQSGEKVYRDALLARALPLVSELCRQYEPDPTLSKDFTMRILQKVSERLPTLRVDCYEAWLTTLTRRECIDFVRAELRRRRELGQTLYLIDNRAGSAPDEQQLSALDEALKRLPAAQWFCLQLFYYRGLSYRQIAATTHYSVAEVKSHLQNGRRRLRQLLQQQGEGA